MVRSLDAPSAATAQLTNVPATFNRLSGRPLETGSSFGRKEVCGRSGSPEVSLNTYSPMWAMRRPYPPTERRWPSGDKNIPYGFHHRPGRLLESTILPHSNRNSREFPRFPAILAGRDKIGLSGSIGVGGRIFGTGLAGRTKRNPADSFRIITSLAPLFRLAPRFQAHGDVL